MYQNRQSRQQQNRRQQPQQTRRADSRIYVYRGIYLDKTGAERESVGLVSLGNTVLIRQAKSGKVYGRLGISGDWNLHQLQQHGFDVQPDESGTVWVTVFFRDRDEEFMGREPDGKTRRAMAGNLSMDNDGGLVFNVNAIGW